MSNTLAYHYIFLFCSLGILLKAADLSTLYKEGKFTLEGLFNAGLEGYNKSIVKIEENFKAQSRATSMKAVVITHLFLSVVVWTLAFLYYVLILDLFGHYLPILIFAVLAAGSNVHFMLQDLFNLKEFVQGKTISTVGTTTLTKVVFCIKYFGFILFDLIILKLVIYVWLRGSV